MNYGMLKLDKKPIDISELLIQLEEELYPLLEKHHLEARLNVAPHLPMHGDGKLLARVFENLLTNAVRYGYDGQFVDMNGYVDNGEVVVQITNYGDSIPEEDLPYLLICSIQVIKQELRTVAGQALDYLLRKILSSNITVRFLLRAM